MIKFIGIILIVASSSLVGIMFSDKLKKRVAELNLINYMLEEISVLIRYKALPVYEIIKALKENQMYNSLNFINLINCNMQIPFNKAWEESIDNSKSELSSNDKKLLKSFGNSLGTSDISGQLASIEVFKVDFKKLEKEATNEYEKKSKLYRSLGILCGMFVSIMLI